MSTRSIYNIEVESVESDGDSWGSDVFGMEFHPLPEYKHGLDDGLDDPELVALLECRAPSPKSPIWESRSFKAAKPDNYAPKPENSPETALLDALEADLDKLVAAGPFDKVCKGCGRKGLKRRRE